MIVAIVPEVSDVYFKDIPNTLEALQAEVGGYIETVRLTTELLAIVNEEGWLMNLPKNRHLSGIAGPMVLVHNAYGNPEFSGLSDYEVSAIRSIFGGHKKSAAAAPTATTVHKKNIRVHDTIICDKSQIRVVSDDRIKMNGVVYRECLVPEDLIE